MSQYSAAAHCAHTMSRLSVDYARMAEEFPGDGPYFMACSREKRQQAHWWLARARMWREAVAEVASIIHQEEAA